MIVEKCMQVVDWQLLLHTRKHRYVNDIIKCEIDERVVSQRSAVRALESIACRTCLCVCVCLSQCPVSMSMSVSMCVCVGVYVCVCVCVCVCFDQQIRGK